MASKTTLNAKNLEALGAERLAELLIEISTGSAANKRRLRVELAGAQSVAEVAREVAKRLSSIERSRTAIGWRKIKALKKDLETQRSVITDTIAMSDPDEALDVMWRFLRLADSIFERCDDSNGTIISVFHGACADLGAIAQSAGADPKMLSDRAFATLQHNDYGQYDGLIGALAEALGKQGLDRLRTLFAEWAKVPVERPPEEERTTIGWGSRGPVYEDEVYGNHRDQTIRLALEQIADAQGDVDAFIAEQSENARSLPAIATGIARRLLAAGRAEDAWNAIGKIDADARSADPFEWQQVRAEVLDALGRYEEAQDFRWQCFRQSLNVDHLRTYLKRLPDFDDMEAEEAAFLHARTFSDVHQALAFFLRWPAIGKAAELVLARHAELNGDLYGLLTPASEMLREKHPLAATLVLRAMIDFSLDQGRSTRYRHAARHIVECEILSGNIADAGGVASHEDYVAALKRRHGKKHGFWSSVKTQ